MICYIVKTKLNNNKAFEPTFHYSFDGIDNITANDGIWFKILTCTQLEQKQRLAFVVENFRKDFLIA